MNPDISFATKSGHFYLLTTLPNLATLLCVPILGREKQGTMRAPTSHKYQSEEGKVVFPRL
jgi:hypothetical protein